VNNTATLELPATTAETKSAVAVALHAVIRPTATSEQLYGISEQPKPTCPIIDAVIANLRKCDREMNRWERHKDDAEYLAQVLDTVAWIIGNIEPDIEKIRVNADKIRGWGQEWKELAKEHVPKPDETESA